MSLSYIILLLKIIDIIIGNFYYLGKLEHIQIKEKLVSKAQV